MKLKNLAAVVLTAALCVSCATQKVLTPEEIAQERERQLNMVTRIYEGKTQQEVLLAADRVFRLADDDYNVSHSTVSLQAQRRWGLYLVLAFSSGVDTWVINTEAMPNGSTKIMAMHSSSSSSAFGAPVATSTGGTSATAMSTPALQNMTTSPAIYQLFFARLDYLLGKKDTWVSCKDAGDLFTEGSLEPFCLVANDRTPDGKSAAQRRSEQERSSEQTLQ